MSLWSRISNIASGPFFKFFCCLIQARGSRCGPLRLEFRWLNECLHNTAIEDLGISLNSEPSCAKPLEARCNVLYLQPRASFTPELELCGCALLYKSVGDHPVLLADLKIPHRST